MVLTPLEEKLKQDCEKIENGMFPNNQNYYDIYDAIKKNLSEKYFENINTALAAREGCVFTDHGPKHFFAVADYASSLVTKDNARFNVTPYEIFLLLTAILLHDAANYFGRDNHIKYIAKIVHELGNYPIKDNIEKKVIKKLAEVHSGKISVNGVESKDTIGEKISKDIDYYGKISYRPRAIAAVLRFADEICEDCNRAARFLLDDNLINPECEIFHKYAESIRSVRVDHEDKSIRIEYNIQER